MKKIVALLLVLVMVAAMAACAPAENKTTGSTESTAPSNSTPESTGTSEPAPSEDEGPKDDPAVKSEGVMTYAEYMAAEMNSVVTIEAYVQATQSWWEKDGQGVITIYSQDLEGGYFLYEVPCSKEDAEKLVPGTKIRVTGEKREWSGEIEIMYATELVILEGEYLPFPEDVTAILGNEEELIKKQNMFVQISGLTIEKIEYKNGEPGDDIYVTVSQDGKEYSFCVEVYLTGPESEVYQMFTNEVVKVGDVVMIEGFLYWYEGVNTHITAVYGRGR